VSFEVRKSAAFEAWHKDLTDLAAQDAITDRVNRVRAGLLGDRRSVGTKIGELRVDVGQGYRLYYTLAGRAVLHLLCGGTKKTQKADIRKAEAMAKATGIAESDEGGSRVRERQAGYGAEAEEPVLTEADLTFSPFDAADYLERDSSQIYVLRNALASGHAGYIATTVDAVARARARREGETAHKRQARSKSPGRKEEPTLETLTTVLNALRLRLEVVEKRATR
jgi:putative addiction module killer protein